MGGGAPRVPLAVPRITLPDTTLVAAIVAVAVAVRLAALRADVLHVDEALFASFGLDVARNGNLLLLDTGFNLDRPPLFFWLLGGVQAALGDTAITIRVPNLLFSAVTVVTVFELARTLARTRFAGAVAALIFALSPFAISFGPTVFEEPAAVALGMVGVLLAARGRPVAGGLAIGLALSVKLFAAVYVPLGMVVALGPTPRDWRSAARVFLGFAVVAGVLLSYMLVRTLVFGAPWFLTMQYEHIGGTRLLPPDEWLPRAQAWLSWMVYFFPDPAAWTVILLGSLLGVVAAIVRRDVRVVVLPLFAAAYFGLLTVMASPVYDRYLSYILPAAAVTVGVGLSWATSLVRVQTRAVRAVVAISLAVLLAPGAVNATREAFPVAGAGHRTYQGYRTLCDWVVGSVPRAEIIWHHSLSWHFEYCLHGIALPAYWYADAQPIVEADAAGYVAVTEADDHGVLAALRRSGWEVTLARDFTARDGTPNMWVYRIEP